MRDKKAIAGEIGRVYPRSLKFLSVKLHDLVEGRLWLKVLIGMVLGIIVGLAFGPSAGFVDSSTAYAVGEWLALPGTIFLAVLQMIVIPLVFASIIRGIASSENIEQLKKTGLTVAAFFIATTVLAIVIGVFLASSIEPGKYVSQTEIEKGMGQNVEAGEGTGVEAPKWAEIPSILTGILPNNIFNSVIHGEMLQVVIFALIFGIALVNMRTKNSKPLLELLGSLQEVCMMIVKWAMFFAPLAVFGLMARLTSRLGVDALLGMSVYVGVVLLGLASMLAFYLAVIYVFTRKGPLDFLRKVKDVLLLAFSTSSSAAVMPLTIKTAEEKLDVRPSVSQFVVPLGATVNMSGTALYQGVATVFLAQVFGVDLVLTALLFLVAVIVGSSIGTPATPGVGIIVLAMVLGSVGIPVAALALIIGVDRILDMCRTAINVTGDLAACVVMKRFVKVETTAQQQLLAEAEREKQRKLLGEDVLIEESEDLAVIDSAGYDFPQEN